ncbi:DUF1080 domain-containing protein [Pontibacter sp. G13]|uniref:3-keto-disaccharide hydrolase n=1 Tax=Pontibacter sp. G13 TaxID=3074898 RepID=UPI00288948A4|nr:DUF1080 domain-containing protein [Pontibacter sp. G13]WNJ17568.1 DUF1080 domain-containing protein [Pontibacter sp. G13]
MKHFQISLMAVCLLTACTTDPSQHDPDPYDVHEWTDLIDEDLSNWDTYLSFQHQPGYDGTAPVDEAGTPIEPIGLNHPDYAVFSTFEETGEWIIRNTGEYYGALITQASYHNYHLQLQYKWGDKTWAFRKHLLKDSGILYHSIGEMGAEYWRSWMLSQEFQIMEGHTGDFWSQATSAIDIRAYKPESNLDPVAHPSQEFLTFSMTSPYKNYCMRSSNFELPHDEWNTLDLYCFGDKSLHVVNGEVVMILQNSRYVNEQGETIPLTEGKIQLQSEAAELFFKGIRIRPIDSLSLAHQALF